MKYRIFSLIFCFISNILYSQIDYSENGNYSVNVLEFKIKIDTKQSRSIPIKLHYPADKGIHSLVIIPHGAGGVWDTHFALAHYFAKKDLLFFALIYIDSNQITLR